MPGDLPATSRGGSAVTVNLALVGRRGRFFPCSETWHIYPVSFNRNQWFTVEYSDTLLEHLEGGVSGGVITVTRDLSHSIPFRNSSRGYLVPRHTIPSFHSV